MSTEAAEMRVYNTLTKTKEKLVPRDPGRIAMYVCGPTVYNYIHIGNARTFLSFDVIRRYIRFRGFDLTDVQNFTDVDDKIIKRAAEEGISPQEVAQKYETAYRKDTEWLGILPAKHTPKATEFIPQMIGMVSALIDREHAYVVDGDVYFAVESFSGYGKLSGRSLEEMRAGERVEIDPRKRHPMDFALWKAAKPGEPFWDSPWGPGRPGWHIECSSMSYDLLQMSFDIHGGAQDLIFPHHENEIAQAEGATGNGPFVRYWLHAGLLNIDKEKMSKSLGNILLLRDLAEQGWRPDEVRLSMLKTHYRQQLDFGSEGLEAARSELESLLAPLVRAEALQATDSPSSLESEGRSLLRGVGGAEKRFREAMDDDFNTSVALAALHETRGELNDYLDRLEKVAGGASRSDVEVLRKGLETYTSLARDVFGLRLEPPTVRRVAQADEFVAPADEQVTAWLSALDGTTELDEMARLLNELVKARDAARRLRDFALADRIRSELTERGYILEDTPQGTRYYMGARR